MRFGHGVLAPFSWETTKLLKRVSCDVISEQFVRVRWNNVALSNIGNHIYLQLNGLLRLTAILQAVSTTLTTVMAPTTTTPTLKT